MSTEKIEGRRKTFAEKVAEGNSATDAYFLAGYRPVPRSRDETRNTSIEGRLNLPSQNLALAS